MTTQQLELHSADSPVSRWAMLSRCERYRYVLTRTWARERGLVNWVMLNPSTADGREDDPTIRRCVGFAQLWGYGGIVVTNLFALRSPDPSVLELDEDPVGPDNDAALVTWSKAPALHVAAWGAHGRILGRARAVRELLSGCRLQCLGLTKAGEPRHPLYLPMTAKLQDLP